VFAFPVHSLLPIPADAAVGVVRGFVALASPTANCKLLFSPFQLKLLAVQN